MSETTCDVLIVGGGVIGCSIAYFLSSSPEGNGLRVRVVERDPTYAQSSTALSVGGIRQQFSTPENIQLSLYSEEFVRNAGRILAVDGEAPDLGYQPRGYLFLASDKGIPVLQRNHLLQTRLGAQIQLLDLEALQNRFPWMDLSGLAGGALGMQGEGWLDPHSLLQALRKKAIAQGVSFITGEVVGFSSEGGRVQKASLAEGEVVAVGQVVNAAGPRAAGLASLAGIPDLPVHPRRRFVYRVQARDQLPGCPLVIDPSGVYFRPEGDGFLCGVSPSEENDPDTTDLEIEYDLFYDQVWPTLASRVPGFDRLRLGSSWAGHYAYNVVDQNAILGPHPRLENFFFANGFSGHGLQHAPGIGRAISELLLWGEYRTLDLHRFGFQRFSQNMPLREENVV